MKTYHGGLDRLVMILVKEHTPSHSALGAANGICEVLQIIGGSVGHLFIGSVSVVSSLVEAR